MIRLTEAAGRVVADEMQHTLAATDAALLTGSRMNASVLEGTLDANMHPRTKQKLLESIASGYDLLLQGRRAMVEGHSQMIVIQGRSNLAEVDFGCVGGPDDKEERRGFFTTGRASAAAAADV